MYKNTKTTLKDRFYTQRWHAEKSRGIDWHLSYEQWLEVWGDLIHQRGRGKGKMHMCRIGDQGAYEMGNVFIGTHEQNCAHPNRGYNKTRMEVFGKVYDSIKQCAEDLGLTGSTIVRWLQKGKHNARRI
jgi:hypothetical protein